LSTVPVASFRAAAYVDDRGDKQGGCVMRVIVALLFLLSGISIAAAQLDRYGDGSDSPKIYSSDGKFLGNLNANPYDPDSVANPYGQYGSRYSPDSINNPYGEYGSRYSPSGARNPYGN
jgi:hypothetical protein